MGYAVVPFLDPDAVERVKEIYWRLGPAPGDQKMAIHFDFQSQSIGYKERVAEELRPILEPRAAPLLDRFHLFSPSFIMKWPGERSGFAPHQDTTLVDEDHHRSITIWCPLVDAVGDGPADNGVIRFVPGSHEFVRWFRAHDPGSFAFHGAEQAIIDRFGVPVPLRAGEAVVFDHRTVHFSMPNASLDHRLVVAMGLRPQEAQLLHFRRDLEVSSPEREVFDVHEIDDEYFIRMNPFAVRLGVPYERVDRIEMPRPTISVAEFERLARAATPNAASSRPRFRDRVLRRRRRVNPDPFCFRCGSVDDLAELPDGSEHGNVQCLCRGCAGSVEMPGRRSA